MIDCTHESATGVDQTPLEDDTKVWRCDACGFIYRNGITSTANDEFLVRVPVVRCSTCDGFGNVIVEPTAERRMGFDQCPACSSTGWVEA